MGTQMQDGIEIDIEIDPQQVTMVVVLVVLLVWPSRIPLLRININSVRMFLSLPSPSCRSPIRLLPVRSPSFGLLLLQPSGIGIDPSFINVR